MAISSINVGLLFMLIITVVGAKEMCPELKCNKQPIRFPFRLKGKHPPECGYPGFDLSCTETNKTVLELPDLVKLHVSKIDYKSQSIHVRDPTGCFLNQMKDLRISASPFRYVYKQNKYGRSHSLTLFSCSSSLITSIYGKDWSCHDGLPHQVVARNTETPISLVDELIHCTKICDVSPIPVGISLIPYGERKDLLLSWHTPNCKTCEAKGMMCALNKTTSALQTECFPRPHPGVAKKLAVTGEVLGPMVLVLGVITLYYIYNSNRLEKETQSKIKMFLEDYKALKPARYSFADIKRITDDFKEELGQGAFGTVFKGKLSTEILVAVKVLNNSKGDGEEFVNEVGTMGRIHHVNVVRLVGFCADGFRRALVYEYLPYSLQKFISFETTKTNFLEWDKLQKIALGVAKGIEYLHLGCEQRILHFDIKPHNILLDHNLNPKITDFGLAKLCSKDQSLVSMTTARGTMGYIAPEVFSRNFGNVSYKSDVYSYGMLLLEMAGRRRINVDVTTENAGLVYFPEWIYNLLERGEDLRIQIEEEDDARIAKKLAIVGLKCIQWHPVDRPSMKNVVQMLEGEGNNLTLPQNPFASTAPKTSNIPAPRKRRNPELDVISEEKQELGIVEELE